MKRLGEYKQAMDWFRLQVEETNTRRQNALAKLKIAKFQKDKKAEKRWDEEARRLTVECNHIGSAISALTVTIEDWDDLGSRVTED